MLAMHHIHNIHRLLLYDKGKQYSRILNIIGNPEILLRIK